MLIRFLLPTLLVWLTSQLAEAATDSTAPAHPAAPAAAVANESPATNLNQAQPATGQTEPTPDASAETPQNATAAGAVQSERLDLAEHEIQSGEFTAAESQLKDAIADIEQEGTRYDRRLARPLTLLGDALAGQGSYSEALPKYEQARHIVRVNDGLHTPEQIEIVYREAETLAKLGKMDEATDRQEYAYDLLLRNHKTYDAALVPGIMKLAEWYERIDSELAARSLYQSAALIQQRASGDLSPALIPPLQGLVRTYRDERFPPQDIPDQSDVWDNFNQPGLISQPTRLNTIVINRFGDGEAALAQIVRINQANPDATPLDVALAELDLADWYLLFDVNDRAITMYRHAREIMRTKAGLNEQQIASYFDGTKALWLPIPDPPAKGIRINPHEGHVSVQYTLTDRGECTHLETLESDPKGLMDFQVRRGLRAARFRPEFSGDTPIDVPDKVYRHDFTYYAGRSEPTPVDRASTPEPASAAAPKKDA